MKLYKLPLFLILFFLSSSKGFSQDNLDKLNFLLANWEISNFAFEGYKWIGLGKTNSKIKSTFDGKFLEEEVKYQLASGEIEMKIYIGFDYRRSSLKMCAMDKDFGVMDIYYGKWEENKLVFTNLESDLPIEMPEGKKLHFKLTYSEIEEDSFIHIVEGTYDHGKSWFPFARSLYLKTN